MGSLLDPERLPESGMLIYICSADKYRRLPFPVEWIRSIFVIVFDANAKRAAPLLSSKPFLSKDDGECKGNGMWKDSLGGAGSRARKCQGRRYLIEAIR